MNIFRLICTPLFLILLAGLCNGASASPQDRQSDAAASRSGAPAEPRRVEADAADVESPEAIVQAMYDVVSVPAGEKRDRDRLRSLFLPEARLIPTGRSGGTESRYNALTVEEYLEGSSGGGLHEQQIHAETERFGDIAHVFSTYAARRSADDPEPFARGINSFQLWHDGERWWIVTLMWHGESEGTSLPQQYLD